VRADGARVTGMHAPRICVVGSGAIGGLIAAKLAATGHPVSVLARGESLRAIAAGGLTVIDGEALQRRCPCGPHARRPFLSVRSSAGVTDGRRGCARPTTSRAPRRARR